MKIIILLAHLYSIRISTCGNSTLNLENKCVAVTYTVILRETNDKIMIVRQDICEIMQVEQHYWELYTKNMFSGEYDEIKMKYTMRHV